jgi:hypothetical protein
MSRKIAIFYHCRLSGGDPPIDPERGVEVMTEQMSSIELSRIREAAAEFYIGVNGDPLAAALLCPKGAYFMEHGPDAKSELPTLRNLRSWCRANPDAFVCYHHSKGVTHRVSEVWDRWRRCMERAVIWRWRDCLAALEGPFDAAGAHWLDFPMGLPQHYFGGNFWWAKASFINTLPALPENASNHNDFYLAEAWIGTGPRLPRVRDLAPHWPMTCQ